MAERIVTTYEVSTEKSIAALRAMQKAIIEADGTAQQSVGSLNAGFANTANIIYGAKAAALAFGATVANSANLASASLSELKAKLESLKIGRSVAAIGSDKFNELSASIRALNEQIKIAESSSKALGSISAKTGTGFNSLSNSINQVSRELPAFTFSAQTGFLAISNNIPILVDSLNQARVANEALVASGGKAVPVWKQLVGAIFSWQTALSVSISLLVLYGKDIGAFITKIFSAGDAFDSAKYKLDIFNQSLKSDVVKSAISANENLGVAIGKAGENITLQKGVLDEYNKTIGTVTGTVKTFQEAEQGFINNTPTYIDAIIKRTAALKVADSIAEDIVKLATEKEELSKNIDENKEIAYKTARDLLMRGMIDVEEFNKQSAKIEETYNVDRLTKLDVWNTAEIKMLEKNIIEKRKLLDDIGGFIAPTKTPANKDGKDGGDSGDLKAQSPFDILNQQIAETEDALKSLETVNVSKELSANIDAEPLAAKLADLKNQLALVTKAFEDITGETLKEDLASAVAEMEQAGKDIEKNSIDLSKEEKEQREKDIADYLRMIDKSFDEQINGHIRTDGQLRQIEINRLKTIEIAMTSFYENDKEGQIKLNEVKKKLAKALGEDLIKSNEEDNKKNEASMKNNLSDELQANEDLNVKLISVAGLTQKDIEAIELDTLAKKIKILKRYKDADAETKKALTEAEKKYAKDSVKIAKLTESQKQKILSGAIDIGQDISDGIFKTKRNNLEAETNFEMASIEAQFQNKLITEEQYNAKRKVILNKEAQTQRDYDLAQIRVNTALAVIKAFATGFTLNDRLIAAGLAAAAGIVQYQVASSQPLPQFAQGTDRVKGGRRGVDSVHALLMPDEAVIPTRRNLERPDLAKAWIGGNLDKYLAMNYINPAINENNKRWENSLKLNQSSTFIRNDNFSDKRIVKELIKSNRINRKIVDSIGVESNNKKKGRLWN